MFSKKLFLLVFIVPVLVVSIPFEASGQLRDEAAKEPLVFESLEQEMRFTQLTLELRCLVCQNQNLADSDAPLAQDLRKEIYDMMMAGRSDEEIKTFLVERYGDFVLYRPPIQGNTLALWAIPMVVLVLGALAVMVAIRNRNRKLAALEGEPREGDS